MKQIVYLAFIFFILSFTLAASGQVVRVPADQPTIHFGILTAIASACDTVLVADGVYTGVDNRDLDLYGHAITVMSENGPESCTIDCETDGRGFNFHSGEQSDSIIRGFTIRRGSMETGGGIFCSDLSSPTIMDCIITECEAASGSAVFSTNANPSLFNCIIVECSTLPQNGVIFCELSNVHLHNCLIHTSTGSGVTLYHFSTAEMTNCVVAEQGSFAIDAGAYNSLKATNCIFRDNSAGQISEAGHAVTYCNVQGGYAGDGNIDADPLFTTGLLGRFYLSQVASGQSQDSPCIDAGNQSATQVCFDYPAGSECLSEYTTRTDRQFDEGVVDIGYHYPSSVTNTETGVTIEMPSHVFSPGNDCACYAIVCNRTGSPLIDHPLFVILEIAGMFFFAPSFSQFDHYQESFPQFDSGSTYVDVLPTFKWPHNCGYFDGAIWYGALTNPEITQLVGDVGTWTFGWKDPL